jgi:hypothetical protein
MFIRRIGSCPALAEQSSSHRAPVARLRSLLTARLTLLAVVSISLTALAPSALAAAPATVTVEVEGLSETKLPPTQVTTTTNPVVKNNKEGNPEGSCSGTSAAGALQLATAGNWSGPWSGKYSQYEIFTIEGETHQFEEGSKANYYWSFWLNDQEATTGACEAELGAGDRVLFFPACYGEACPPSPTPLGIEAPTSADAGESVAVTVKQYNAKGEALPAAGATVSGGGTSAMTDSQGHAAMRFSGDGTYTLEATGSPEALTPGVRTETAICVHEGNDGTCGTKVPAPPGVVGPLGGQPIVNATPPPVSAKIAGVSSGHIYTRGKSPRVLKGTVTVPTGALLRDVEISLKRRYRGRCFQFSGRRGRFVAIKCGKSAAFFSVGAKPSFSYLLPAHLPRGRYTYKVEAVNGDGQATKLADGVSGVVFYVH